MTEDLARWEDDGGAVPPTVNRYGDALKYHFNGKPITRDQAVNALKGDGVSAVAKRQTAPARDPAAIPGCDPARPQEEAQDPSLKLNAEGQFEVDPDSNH